VTITTIAHGSRRRDAVLLSHGLSSPAVPPVVFALNAAGYDERTDGRFATPPVDLRFSAELIARAECARPAAKSERPGAASNANGRLLLFIRHVRPTRCRLRPSRSMKVFSSDFMEPRIFGTRLSLVTNFATHRVRDSSARSDWTRRAASSSSNTSPSGPDVDLRSEQSGGAYTEGRQEVVVPPPHSATTRVLAAGRVAPEHGPFRRQRPRV